MPKYVWVFLFFLFSCSSAIVEDDNHARLFNPPEVKEGMTLNVEDCVALAIKNSPKIKRKKYELDIARTNVKLARSRYFPVISAGAGFNYERNSNSIYYDKKYRDLPNVGVAINKMVWDFGKTTSLIKMEQFYKISAEYEFMDTLCCTLFDIKQKYYNLLRLMALDKIADEDMKLNERFLSITKKEIDKSTARVYLTASKSKKINAFGNMGSAKIDLSNVMYLEKYPNYSIKYTDTFSDFNIKNKFAPVTFPFKESEAAEIAYENSPDLAVIVNTKNAMEQSLKYIKKQYLPEIGADAGYGYVNSNFASNNSFRVGVNISAQTNPMELKYDIERAHAQLDIAENEISLFKKDLYYEVVHALANVGCYEEQMPKLEDEIIQAKKSMDMAFKKYEANLLDYTALHDSIEDYILAREKYVECLYNYNMSLIQTEMAMHYHLVDIHQKAQHALHHHTDELIEHLNDALDCSKKDTGNKKRKNK